MDFNFNTSVCNLSRTHILTSWILEPFGFDFMALFHPQLHNSGKAIAIKLVVNGSRVPKRKRGQLVWFIISLCRILSKLWILRLADSAQWPYYGLSIKLGIHSAAEELQVQNHSTAASELTQEDFMYWNKRRCNFKVTGKEDIMLRKWFPAVCIPHVWQKVSVASSVKQQSTSQKWGRKEISWFSKIMLAVLIQNCVEFCVTSGGFGVDHKNMLPVKGCSMTWVNVIFLNKNFGIGNYISKLSSLF